MLNIKTSRENVNLYTISLFVILSILPLFDGGFDNNISMYMALFIVIVLFLDNNIYKDSLSIDLQSPIFWYFIYLLWCGLSYIWSIYYLRSMVEFMELVLYGAVFFVSSKLNRKDSEKIIFVVLLIGSGIALLGILEYLLISNRRITSTFTNPNPFATYILLLFLFSWATALNINKKSYHITSLILLIALLLTGSRAAFIATFIAFPFVFIKSSKDSIKEKLLKSILLLALALTITYLIIYLAPIIQESMGKDMFDFLVRKDSLIGSSLVGRLEFWKVAFQLFMNRRLLGYGLGTYFSAYYIEYNNNQWYSRFAHNHYLQILSEVGIIGLILFLLFVFFSFKVLYKKTNNTVYSIYLPGIIAACIGFLLHIGAEFSFNFSGATVIFFWLLGMGVGKDSSQINTKKYLIGYRFKNFILLILAIIIIYNFTFLKLYSYAYKVNNEGDKDKALKIVEFSNKYYRINPFGYELESGYYYDKYKDLGSRGDLIKTIDLYHKALDIAPYDGALHNKMGGLYFDKGDMDKAEEHYILGARYGAYRINRYLDLGLFYLNQARKIDAEEALLKGTNLKEYDIKRAGLDKDSRIIDAALMHYLLLDIYRETGQEEKKLEQVEEIENMLYEYPFLKEYIDLDRIKGEL